MSPVRTPNDRDQDAPARITAGTTPVGTHPSPDTTSDGTTLEFVDSVSVQTTRRDLWRRLSDPAFLARCLPGVESIERVSDRCYSVVLQRDISHLRLTAAGEVEITEMHEPEWMIVEGSGYDGRTHTEFAGTAALEMTPLDNRNVELSHHGYLTFRGGARVLTPRLLRGIVETDVKQFFHNLHQSDDQHT